jgi:hypothetical protein
MHWILQNNLFNEDAYHVLLDTLVRFNIPHSIHKVIPFIGELTPEVELDTSNVICMGSYSLRHSAKKFGWTPGVFDLEPMDFREQLARWGEHMLNYDSVISRFEDADLSTKNPHFVRPIHDSKVFAGRVYEYDEFWHWKRNVCVLNLDYGDSLNNDTLVQVVPPKNIFSEHRFWVVKGEIVTSSTYKLGHKVIYQPLPTDSIFEVYVKERISEWQPHDAFVIDVCDTEDGLKIVEINTLNSCGFYACDMQKLVMALENSFSVQTFKESYEIDSE